MSRLALISDFYEKTTDYHGSAIGDVCEDAFHVMGAIAEEGVAEVYVDGELFDFMSCTFELEDPIWEFVKVVEEEE